MNSLSLSKHIYTLHKYIMAVFNSHHNYLLEIGAVHLTWFSLHIYIPLHPAQKLPFVARLKQLNMADMQ